MAVLRRCDLLFIAETDHFSLVQENNEQLILEQMLGNEKATIAIEDISDPRYCLKRKMLMQYSDNSLLYLPSDNQEMLKTITPLAQKGRKAVVIAGSKHLTGALSVDVLVRYRNKDIESTVVILDEEFPAEGIYKKQTTLGMDFIVVGSLRQRS